MAILYRAIWTEDRSDLTDLCLASFGEWVKLKSEGGILAPASGVVKGRSITWDGPPSKGGTKVEHDAEVSVEHLRDGTRSVLRASFVELKPDGSRWATTLRSWEGFTDSGSAGTRHEPHGQWVWIDVEAVSDDSLDGVVIAAPGLALSLLDQALNPRRKCVPLATKVVALAGEDDAEALGELLTHEDRDIPVVVFAASEEVGVFGSVLQEVSSRVAARKAAGVAAVYSVDAQAVAALGEILGPEFVIAPGGFRIYLPGLDPARTRDDWRHRETRVERFSRYAGTAGTLILRSIGPGSATRRAPTSYEPARLLLESASDGDTADLYSLLELADVQAADQRVQLSKAEDRYVDLLSDFEDKQTELARLSTVQAVLRSDLDRALTLLRQGSLEDEFWSGKATETAVEVPSQASSSTEAALLATEHLSQHLHLADGACVDLEDLDASVESRAWGQTAWEAFRALAAYGESRKAGVFVGSFWNWCESGHPLAWRATSKKLAMVESDSLRKDKGLWAKRMLPVAAEFDASERTRMEAYIKIAEGGGNLAPRIYFVFDEPRCLMRVGYFGPHRNMPNSKS